MIYTRDNAMLIIEKFEDLLCKNNIKIPSPEDDERDEDNDAALYGSVYSDLLDSVEYELVDMLKQHETDKEITTDCFSGTV